MFGKSNSAEEQMKKVDSEAISSIIDKSMTITGTMTFKGKARIDGTVKGNVEGDHLILSQTGRIEGDIQVESFNCFGNLLGNIKTGILIARKGCCLNGKLEAASLTVEPGARIEGEIKAATTPSQTTKESSIDAKPQSK